MHFSLTGKFPVFRYNCGSTKDAGFPKDDSLTGFKKCLFSKLFSVLETKTQFSECPRVSIRQHWLISMIDHRYVIQSQNVMQYERDDLHNFCWTNTWTFFWDHSYTFMLHSTLVNCIFWKNDCLQKQPPGVYCKTRRS